MPYQDPVGGGAPLGGGYAGGGYSGLYGLPGLPGSAGGFGQFQPWQGSAYGASPYGGRRYPQAASWGQPGPQASGPQSNRMASANSERLPPDQRCYDVAGREVPCSGNPPGHYNDPKINGGEWSGGGGIYRGPEVGTTNGGQGYGQGTQGGGADFPLYLQELFRNYAKAGYFDPRGNQMLIESGRQNAAASSAATQRQMSLAAQSRGTDPTQRASYELQSMLGGQGAQMNQINQLMNAAAQNQNQFAQGLGQAWGGQQPLPADTSPGAADYALQIILALAGMGKR